MLIQVISDIHGSASDLEQALGAFQAKKPDLYLLCGDFLNHGPRNPLPAGYDTKAVAAILNGLKERIVCVRGNCDSEVDQMMLDFPCLAPYTSIFVGEGRTAGGGEGCSRIFAHHGHLYDRAQLASWLPAGTLVVSGHTHVTVLERDAETGLVFLNPGSISIPKCGDGKTCALIESNGSGVRRITLCGIDGRELRSLPL